MGGFKVKPAPGDIEKLSNTARPLDLNNLILITGGARSGKSLLAEKIATDSNRPVVYLATMEEMHEDAETVMRIDLHRSRRPKEWRTVESPFSLSSVILDLEADEQTCIIDCISLLVSNILLKTNGEGTRMLEARVEVLKEITRVLAAMKERPKTQFLAVTNEVGSGIVPENALARSYRDLLGETNQLVAASAHRVFLCCAGIHIHIK